MSDEKQLAALNAFSNALARASEEEIINTLCASVYPGAKRESALMVLAYCKAAGLDPMLKPVHIVPMNVKDSKTGKYEWRDVIMPGVGLYRIQASRTGECAGISEPVYGPDVTENLGGVSVTFPEWCSVTVKRVMPGGQIAEFTAKEYWIENYATAGKDELRPNAMWARRKRGQIAKCAQAQALRTGFPEVGQQPTAEEMEGKEFDITPSQPPRRVSESVNTVIGEVLRDEPPKLPEYTTESFDTNWSQWVGLVDSGKQSWANIKKNLCSKHSLTEAQISYLDNPETYKKEPQA